MDIIKRIIGAFLVIHGVACGLFSIIEHLFDYVSGLDASALGYSPVWLYLDPATAVGIALALLFALLRKMAMQRDGRDGSAGAGITRAYLEANALFYGFLFVAILFYRLWLGDLTGRGSFPVAADVQWSIVYALYPLLSVALGLALARGRQPTA